MLTVGVLQNYARKLCIPIDKLGFEFEMTRLSEDQQQNVKPDNGAYIYVSACIDDDDDLVVDLVGAGGEVAPPIHHASCALCWRP